MVLTFNCLCLYLREVFIWKTEEKWDDILHALIYQGYGRLQGQEAGILPCESRSHSEVRTLQGLVVLEAIIQVHICLSSGSTQPRREEAISRDLLAGWSRPRKAGCLVINSK